MFLNVPSEFRARANQEIRNSVGSFKSSADADIKVCFGIRGYGPTWPLPQLLKGNPRKIMYENHIPAPLYPHFSMGQPHPWLDSKNMVCWEFSAFPFVHDWLKMVGSRRRAIQGKNKYRRLHANPSQSLGRSHNNQGILLALLPQTLTSVRPGFMDHLPPHRGILRVPSRPPKLPLRHPVRWSLYLSQIIRSSTCVQAMTYRIGLLIYLWTGPNPLTKFLN